MSTSDPTRKFEVEITVTGSVFAKNAGDAVETLCEYVRQGLGDDTATREHKTVIAHGRATTQSVFTPERAP